MRRYFKLLLKIIVTMSWVLLGEVRVHAQPQRDVRIVGHLVDSVGSPVEGVSIRVISRNDSVLTVSRKDGRFSARIIYSKSMTMILSHLGYVPGRLLLDAHPDSAYVDLGTIVLRNQVTELEATEVSARPKISAHGDTIFFETNHIEMEKGSFLWELLDNIPGMKASGYGSLSYMGQTVENVRINGVDFFGGDIGLALRNLPADLIERLQLIDDYGPESAATGFRVGGAKKILNLSIADENDRGMFTEGNISYGADERYLGDLGAYYFHGGRQIAGSLGMNNQNILPAWLEESKHREISNPEAQWEGIQRFGGGRLHYAEQWKERFTSNFGFIRQRQVQDLSSLMEEYRDFGAAGTLYRQTTSQHRSSADGYQFGGNQQQSPLIRYESTGKQTSLRILGHYKEASQSQDYMDEQLQQLREGDVIHSEHRFLNRTLFSENSSEGHLSVSFTQKLNELGSTLSIHGRIRSSDNRLDEDRDYLPQTIGDIESLDPAVLRSTDQQIRSQTALSSLTYTAVIDQKTHLQTSFIYSRWKNASIRDVFDRGNFSDSVLEYIDSLSSSSDVANQSVKGRVGIQKNFSNGWRYNFQVEGDIQSQSGTFKHIGYLHQRSAYVAPIVRLVKRSSRMAWEMYSGWQVGLPTLQQLNPVGDATDPLIVRKGNPHLTPEKRYTLTLGWNLFQSPCRVTSRVSLSGNYVWDKIVPKVVLHPDLSGRLIQEIGFANLGGDYAVDVTYHADRTHLYPGNTKGRTTVQGATNFLHELFYEGESVRRSIRSIHSIRISESYEKRLLRLRASLGYRLNWVHEGPVYGEKAQQDVRCELSGEATLFGKHVLSASLVQSFRSGYSPLLPSHPTIIGFVLRRDFLRRRLQVSFSASDLLNQRISAGRQTQYNEVLEVRNNSLRRQIQLSVRWNLGKFGEGMPLFLFR